MFGKWHLGHGPDHDPTGFDEWKVLPDQGEYHDPVFLSENGTEQITGYVTDIITDLSLDWLDQRDPDRPFALMIHHEAPHFMQGTSFLSLLDGVTPDDWQAAMYYRYWMHRDRDHNVWAHYGIRTHAHKLIYFYNDPLGQPGAHLPADPPEWELFDLEVDPFEMNNVIDDAEYAAIVDRLKRELFALQAQLGDEPRLG